MPRATNKVNGHFFPGNIYLRRSRIEGLVGDTTDIPPDQGLHDFAPVSSCMTSAADLE